MKKLFTLLCLLITIGAFAQVQVPKSLILQPTEVRTMPPSRGGVGDTLFWATGDGSTPALYRLPDPFTPGDIAGYIAGTDQLNSSFGDGETGNFVSEEAQIFNNTNKIKLIGVKFCFGAKRYVSADPNSKMLFRLYQNDGTYVNSNSQLVTGPGTLLTEVAVRLDSIRILRSGIDNLYTGSQQIVFPAPIIVDSGYTFGICIDSLNAIDTIGLFTSTTTTTTLHPPDMSLVKFVGNDWANYADTLYGWGYDLDLAIFPIVDFTQYDTISANICLGSTYNYNGSQYNTTGTVYDTIIRDGGTYYYDSVVTINLTVNPDTTVLASGDTLLTARATTGATYQWIDCATQQPINGATSAEFKPAEPGHYELQIMQGGCMGTSSCHAALISSVHDIQQVQFDLRPNPARDVCTIYPGGVHGTWNGMLYNIQGQLVQHLFTGQDMQPVTFSTASLSQGIYLIKVNTDDGKIGMQKLVVE